MEATPHPLPLSEEQQLTPDGAWRLVCVPHARIVETRSGRAVLDLVGTSWHCEGCVNPSASQLWLRIRDMTEAPYLDVFIDLDCQLYWETDAERRFLAGGRLAAPLAELQAQLSQKTLTAHAATASGPATPATAARPQLVAARTLWSLDRHYRVELEPNGLFETSARGERKPCYDVSVYLHFRGTRLLDTRKSGHQAWLSDDSGTPFELSRRGAAAGERWVVVDVEHGVCWLDHVRGPLSAELPLSGLPGLLEEC